jgi:hypothetical protein
MIIIKNKRIAIMLGTLAFVLICLGVFALYWSRIYPPEKVRNINVATSEVIQKRKIVEEKFPEFKDYEKQDSFAGKGLVFQKLNDKFYFGYLLYGSGLPIVGGTCFEVDSNNNVIQKTLKIEHFAFTDVDLVNCTSVEVTK